MSDEVSTLFRIQPHDVGGIGRRRVGGGAGRHRVANLDEQRRQRLLPQQRGGRVVGPALLELRKLLSSRGLAKEFWE